MNQANHQAMAVIGRITSLSDIPGADRIKLAQVDCGPSGQWSGVIGAGLGVTDLATVFLQDALLPPDPRWDFMSRHKWRVRMARFKGVPSECVIIAGAPNLPVGTDLSESLGVTKYSKPIAPAMAGVAKGNFPSYIPKTDEPNFQTVADQLAELLAEPWVASLKCDGTSCTAWNDEHTGSLRVASRNLELLEFTDSGAGNVYWQTARKYDLSQLPAGTALQFEVIGPGIQGNPMGLDQVEGRAFTLYDIESAAKRPQCDLEYACHYVGMPMATILFFSQGGDKMSSEHLRNMAQVTYPNGKPGEGIVLRTLDHRISLKVLNLLYKN